MSAMVFDVVVMNFIFMIFIVQSIYLFTFSLVIFAYYIECQY